MEIGSFIEMQFPHGNEYYKGDVNIARLNSGRAAIYHAVRVLNCKTVWLPYYQCNTVRDFLIRKNIQVKYYFQDSGFNPKAIDQEPGEAVVLVNYFGIMSRSRMVKLAADYDNVIIDNTPAFFCKPIEKCMNVYSTRKFIGVPDGAYVIGNRADKYVNEYEQCYSSDTAVFLLQTHEYGCEGKTYASRMINEHRIDEEDIMKMSTLTRTILDGTDYNEIILKRKQNFSTACRLLNSINSINPNVYADENIVPMVYPLIVENDNLLQVLLKNKHFQSHWWKHLVNEMNSDTFEYWISKYVIPITIDQRYGEEELIELSRIIISNISN